MTDVDVVVVGAGPAGACAATVLARKGRSVLLLERGPFPGSKNMYGGVVYPRMLDLLHPEWWDDVPYQRWVTRRSTMLLTDSQALTVDFRTRGVGTSAVQRHDRVPTRLRPLARPQGRGRRRRAGVLDHRHRPAPRRRSSGRRADRPARRRRHGGRRHRLRRRQQLPAPRRPASSAPSTPATTRSVSKRRSPCPRRSSTSGSRCVVAKVSTSRSSAERAASTAARSSTPTSTRSVSACGVEAAGAGGPVDPSRRRSSPRSRRIRRSHHSSTAASSTSTRRTSSPRPGWR